MVLEYPTKWSTSGYLFQCRACPVDYFQKPNHMFVFFVFCLFFLVAIATDGLCEGGPYTQVSECSGPRHHRGDQQTPWAPRGLYPSAHGLCEGTDCHRGAADLGMWGGRGEEGEGGEGRNVRVGRGGM